MNDDDASEVLCEFVANAPVTLLMLDHNLCNLRASPSWIGERSRGRFEIGMHHYDECPYVLPHWKEAHQAALNGQASRGVDHVVVGSEDRWASWTVTPWGRKAGKPRGIIIHVDNLTARNQMYQSLQNSRQELHALLGQYCKSMCSCQQKNGHAPTCMASPDVPLIKRAENALRDLSRIEEYLKIRT